MRFISKIVCAAMALVCFDVASAQASSVYEWQAEDRSVSVTFPDSWTRVHNQNPVDLLSIEAPGDVDHAGCVISAREDGRFKIYPWHYQDEIQRTYINADMWALHFDQKNHPVFHFVKDDSGLGHAAATMAHVSYDTAVGRKMRKRAIAFAGLSHGMLYMVECSAQEDAYLRWHDAFLSFIKSVEIRGITNHALSGYYRNFIDDAGVKIKGARLLEDSHY